MEGEAARRQARIILLEKRNQHLEEAMRFYADRNNWQLSREVAGPMGSYLMVSEVDIDQGEKARTALFSEAPEKGEG